MLIRFLHFKTSYSLAFVMYNLSVNKTVQDKLYQEFREIMPAGSNEPTVTLSEAISKTKYLKHVVKESMRMFPVSVGTSRVTDSPFVIRGYKIPSNVMK